MVLYVISTSTWPGSFRGNPARGIRPVGPTFLGHGYSFASFPDMPDMITLVDVAQQSFICVLGLMQAQSFYERCKREGTTSARLHVLKRFAGLMALAFVLGVLLPVAVGRRNWDLRDTLLHGTLGVIAWASLAAGIATDVFRNAKHRVIFGVLLLLGHSILYAASPGLFYDELGNVAVGVIGAGFAPWLFAEDGRVNEGGFRTHLLPFAAASYVAMYAIDFVQPASNKHATASLAFFAIGTSLFWIFIFHQFGKHEFWVPGLVLFGRNMLVVFLMTSILTRVYFPLIVRAVTISRVHALLLAGVVPLAATWAVAMLLAKRKTFLKI